MKNWTRTAHSSELLTFRDIEVWTHEGMKPHCDVVLRDGRLVEIRPAAKPVVRKNRVALMPAAVDTQVHMRTPGQWEKETPDTALLAALKGGVGALLTMPNTKPVLDTVEALDLAKAQVSAAESRFGVRVLYSVAGTDGQKGEKVAPLEDLVKAGAVAVTDDGKGVSNDGVQLEIFMRLQPLGIPFLQHAETLGAEGPLADGPVPRKQGLKPYSAKHETDMVARDLKLLEKAPNARYHLLHTSSGESVPLIEKAKAAGFKVTAEVSPHHLYFSSDDIDEGNTSFKMNPPIRSNADREALIDGLASGAIDWVATDHAPHEMSTKTKPFADASFGTLGLETMVPVILDLVQKRRLTPARAVQVMSTAPAKFLGLSESYGHLRVGAPMRAILVNPDVAWTVRAQEHSSLSKNTCFDGARLTGKVIAHVTPSGIWSAEDIFSDASTDGPDDAQFEKLETT
ncbi:dihydroorotase [soil metagenome]